MVLYDDDGEKNGGDNDNTMENYDGGDDEGDGEEDDGANTRMETMTMMSKMIILCDGVMLVVKVRMMIMISHHLIFSKCDTSSHLMKVLSIVTVD